MCLEIVTDPILGMRIRSDGYVDNGSYRGFQKGSHLNKSYYKITPRATTSPQSVHVLIAQAFVPRFSEHFDIVDHIDHDGHNNDRNNLRWVNQMLNGINRKKARNAFFDKRINIWYARLSIFGQSIYLGHFKLENEALDVARHFKQLAFYAAFMSFVKDKKNATEAQARGDCYLHGSVSAFDLAVKFLDSRVCGSRALRRAIAIIRGFLPTFCRAENNSDTLGRIMRGPSFHA